MKLLNDFFQIVALDSGEEIVGEVQMNPAHSIYHAHFPGNPITPGVCLVQMSTEILEMAINRRLQLKTAIKIKFRKPMGPSVRPTFIFQKLKVSEQQVSVQVTVEDQDTQYAKMNLMYNVTGQ